MLVLTSWNMPPMQKTASSTPIIIPLFSNFQSFVYEPCEHRASVVAVGIDGDVAAYVDDVDNAFDEDCMLLMMVVLVVMVA